MRARRIFVSPELITALLTESCTFQTWVTSGLPEGAQLVGVAYSADKRSWAFDFTHPSFDDLVEGQDPPVLAPTYVRHTFTRHPATGSN